MNDRPTDLGHEHQAVGSWSRRLFLNLDDDHLDDRSNTGPAVPSSPRTGSSGARSFDHRGMIGGCGTLIG